MPYLTNYQYYLNGGSAPTNANHGSYQYVSVKDVVNNYMFAYVGQDKIVDNVDRSLVRFHAKQCIKELNYDALKEIKVLEAIVGDDLKLVMPYDYVDYIRMSLLQDGTLYPLVENSTEMSAKAYLYDNNDDLQFDMDGNVLYAPISDLDQARIDGTSTSNINDFSADCCYYYVGQRYGDDPSQMNVNPKFRVNRRAGVIDFDSSMSGQKIVIEYVSDGMEGGVDSEIMINKFFEKYIYAYITYSLLDSKVDIPLMRIENARKSMRALYRNARIRINKMNPADLLMTLRGQQKWIK